MKEQSSVLITGGAGFIGSALVRQWLEHEPERVVNLDKLTYAGLRASLAEVVDHPRHLLVEGDVADAGLVRVARGASAAGGPPSRGGDAR